jgi:L-serine/L-threonine ammonia-lyase
MFPFRVVSDSEALDACFRFSDDHRLLVEPACGASLAALYSGLDLDLDCGDSDLPFDQRRPIVMIVCGGNVASIAQFLEWRQQLEM